jgi:hypothetical protein
MKKTLLALTVILGSLVGIAQIGGGNGISGGVAGVKLALAQTWTAIQTYTVQIIAPAFYLTNTSQGPWLEYMNDFFSTTDMATGAIGSTTGNSGLGLATVQDINHPGNIGLVSGTGGSGTGEFGVISGSGIPQLYHLNTAPNWVMEYAVYPAVLPLTTSENIQTGLAFSLAGTNNASDIGFDLAAANSGFVSANDWGCMVGTNITDSGILATVAWHRLTMSTDGTYLHFFVDGVEATACKTTQSTIGTTYQYLPTWTIIAGTASSVTLYLDYVQIQRQLSR